jgi:NAD(P)-dependent dehydrogenase (short-subunit alcohol dehydrogenase family)
MMRFSNVSVIITGAGSGIGQAIAEAFAKEGAGVIVSDIILERAEQVASGIVKLGGKALSSVGDVVQTEYCQEVVHLAMESYGRLDILCNVAGVNDGAPPPHEMSVDMWKHVIEVNLTGAFLMTRAALPHMLDVGSGTIINMASIGGIVGLGGAAYSASKFGLIGLTQSTAATYAEDGIRCVAICPGRIPTRLNELTPYSETMRTKRRQGYRSKQPVGSVQDIAEITLFVASEGGRFINGASLVADGGFLVM